MLAVLEASPHHHRRFLASPWPRAALIGLGLKAVRAALRVVVGVVWVRGHGVLWR
jgi:hypothetical protein